MSRKLSFLVFTKMYFVDQLRSLGHRVITVGFNKRNFELCHEDLLIGTEIKEQSALNKGFDLFFPTSADIEDVLSLLPKDFFPDCIIYHDDSNPVLYVSGLEKVAVPVIFYSIDAHLHGERHSLCGGIFDKCQVAQKDHVAQFKQYCPDSEWFPLWTRLTYAPAPVKDIPVCFRGGMDPKINPKRVDFMNRLSALLPLDKGTGPMCDVFSRAKIVVNQVINKDLNFRVYEAMMGEALVVTPFIENGQHDLFIDRKHLVEYEEGNVQDAADKILYYLNHDEERMRIAAQGRIEVLKKHTDLVRTKQLEEIALSLQTSARPFKHFSAAYHHLLYTKIEGWLLRREELARKHLLAARDSIVSSAIRREALTNNYYVANLLSVRALLLEAGLRGESVEMMRTVWLDGRGDRLFLFGYLYALMQEGFREEASAVARSVGGGDEMTSLAVEQISQLEKSILSQLEKEKQNSRPLSPDNMR